LKSESDAFAMQNNRFYRAKQALLRGKTMGFIIHL